MTTHDVARGDSARWRENIAYAFRRKSACYVPLKLSLGSTPPHQAYPSTPYSSPLLGQRMDTLTHPTTRTRTVVETLLISTSLTRSMVDR